MTLGSVICFKIAAALILAFAAEPLLAGTVAGRITLVESKNSAVEKRNDFSGVVVWLQPQEERVVTVARRRAQMIQKNKKFVPHILAIQTGTSVAFPNLDPIFHNAFSTFDGQIFDVSLYPPGTSRTVRFDRPGIVRVFCNIHPSMSAIIVVVNSNYFTVTNRKGYYSLANVRPGKYRIYFFHERATQETLEKLTHTVVVDNQIDELEPVTISEAGYLPMVHKNKYGQDYAPNSEDADGYALPIK